MTQFEILTELLRGCMLKTCPEQARYLIANGVIVQKHGQWVRRRFGSTDVFCSECRTLQTNRDSNYKSRHCPNCGAKMDGEEPEL